MSKKSKAKKDASDRLKKLENDNFKIRKVSKQMLELAEKKALSLQDSIDRVIGDVRVINAKIPEGAHELDTVEVKAYVVRRILAELEKRSPGAHRTLSSDFEGPS